MTWPKMARGQGRKFSGTVRKGGAIFAFIEKPDEREGARGGAGLLELGRQGIASMSTEMA